MTAITSAEQLDQLWDYDDPAGSQARFQALLALPEAPLRLEILTQVARAQGLQRQFDAAHATLDLVAAGLETHGRPVQVRYWLERGRVFRSSGETAAARGCFETAFQMSLAAGDDFYTVDAAHMLGIVADSAESQIAWNERALSLAQTASNPRAQHWFGALANNLGWAYHDRGDYTQALDLFQKALAWRETQGNPTNLRIARWCVARALRSLGRVDEALAQQQTLHAEWQAAGGSDGYVLEEIAECLWQLGRRREAQPYFYQAYTLLSHDPWLAEAEPARLNRLQRLAAGNDETPPG